MKVMDQGIGIKESDFTKIFSMFGKLQRTAEMNCEGIGLGLTFCKEVLNEMEGEI